MKKIFMCILIIIGIISIGVISYRVSSTQISSNKDTKEEKKDLMTINNQPSQQDTSEKPMLTIAGVDYDLTKIEHIYRIINEMAHTKVVAEVRERYVEITPERLDLLIQAVTKSDWKDKDFLLKNLNKWKNNDFSQSVEFHNYVWEKQGGEIGKATSLKKDTK